MGSMGKRISAPEPGTEESAGKAVWQRACKSLAKKKEKVPEMLFYSTVRKDSRRLWIKDLTKGKGRRSPERQKMHDERNFCCFRQRLFLTIQS